MYQFSSVILLITLDSNFNAAINPIILMTSIIIFFLYSFVDACDDDEGEFIKYIVLGYW